MSKLAASHSGLHSLWLLVLLVTITGQVHGQSSSLTECRRVFYRGDYALAAQLAERHLHKYPKDSPVRVILARVAKAAVKKLDELNRAEVPDQSKVSTGSATPKPKHE